MNTKHIAKYFFLRLILNPCNWIYDIFFYFNLKNKPYFYDISVYDKNCNHIFQSMINFILSKILNKRISLIVNRILAMTPLILIALFSILNNLLDYDSPSKILEMIYKRDNK